MNDRPSQLDRVEDRTPSAILALAISHSGGKRRMSADGEPTRLGSPATTRPQLFDHSRIDVLGVRISPVSMAEASTAIERCVLEKRQTYVCVTGAHGIMESRRSELLRDIHNRAVLVVPDGMPLVWFAQWSGASSVERVYGPDLMRTVTAVSEIRGYRQFYYGGAEGVVDRLKEALLRRHPNLRIAGAMTPPFREITAQEDEAQVREINAARPDILWIGLSTPKQELWMAAHLGRIDAPVMIGVGAAFDFLAGTKRQAPCWMQRSGLEWLFRLLTEPRRLWRRYLYIVPGFAFLVIGRLALRGVRRVRMVR